MIFKINDSYLLITFLNKRVLKDTLVTKKACFVETKQA